MSAGETLGRRRRLDVGLALGLAVGTVLWLLAVEGRQGIGRDEAQYFRAAEHYWGWFEALGRNIAAGRPGASFSRGGIETYWGDNPEHPVVMKTLYGFSWRLFHRCECVKEAAFHQSPVSGKHVTLPLFARESTAFRFGAILFAGLGAALVYLFGRRFIGRAAAVGAALLSVAQPHYFFHAQIAAFDAPITVMAVALAYCYWKSLRSFRWAVVTGVVFGIALGVKHNAWLMPIFLAGHFLWMRRGDLRRLRSFPASRKGLLLGGLGTLGAGAALAGAGTGLGPAGGGVLIAIGLLSLAAALGPVFLSMAVLGPLVFFLHWPKVWANPVAHTRGYMLRHLEHEHYNFEYLGLNWNLPPKDWDLRLLRTTFPFVSTAFTVPATTLALAAVGTVLLVRRASRRRQDDDDDVVVLLTESAAPPAEGAAPQSSWRLPGGDVDPSPGAFLLVQTLGPMAVIALPSTPIFGGVKHFMTAMPFLAIAAGVGLRWIARVAVGELRQARLKRVAPAALAALVSLPAVTETARSHPDGLSHYNLLAGGFAGGASLGMNRQFWGYSVLPMLGWMTKNVPPSRATYWHDVFSQALSMYVRDGRIPPHLGDVGVGEDVVKNSQLGIVVHEKHFLLYEALLWESYGTTRPAFVRTREGVPLVTAYRRRELPPPSP